MLLLLLDNHHSHISVAAIDFCRAHGIVMLSFPPHCSHLLQPLDRSVFGPLKHYVSTAADLWMKNHPGQHMTIYDIPSLVAATITNLAAGFYCTGIWPLNPEVFDKDAFALSFVTDRPPPPPPPPSHSADQVPEPSATPGWQPPYSRQAPLKVKCVGNHRSQKALTFVSNNNKIDVGTYKVTTLSVLTDGQTAYMSIKNRSDPEFEEGGSYVVKNVTLSKRYGRPCIFVNRDSRKFKTSPLAVTKKAERAAKEAICHAQIPILDLCLRCGTKLHNISLCREEALVEWCVRDKVEVTHLKANIRLNGVGKFYSSDYTYIVECQILEAELEIIGVSEDDGLLILLDSELEDYAVPKDESSMTHQTDLSFIGGANPGECVRRVTRAVATNNVWSNYSLHGKWKKLPLTKTSVCKVITHAAMKCKAGLGEKDIESLILLNVPAHINKCVQLKAYPPRHKERLLQGRFRPPTPKPPPAMERRA
ncbi:unnamed protein product [Leuciscus chuanchicus]